MTPAESYRPSGDPEGCRALGMIRSVRPRYIERLPEAVSNGETEGSFGRYSCSEPLSCRRSTKRISAPLPLIESRLADVGRMANEVVSIQARSPLAVTCADEVGCIFSEGGRFLRRRCTFGQRPYFPCVGFLGFRMVIGCRSDGADATGRNGATREALRLPGLDYRRVPKRLQPPRNG